MGFGTQKSGLGIRDGGLGTASRTRIRPTHNALVALSPRPRWVHVASSYPSRPPHPHRHDDIRTSQRPSYALMSNINGTFQGFAQNTVATVSRSVLCSSLTPDAYKATETSTNEACLPRLLRLVVIELYSAVSISIISLELLTECECRT